MRVIIIIIQKRTKFAGLDLPEHHQNTAHPQSDNASVGIIEINATSLLISNILTH